MSRRTKITDFLEKGLQKGDSIEITNKSKLITMLEAFDSIPGFATIVTA